MTVAKPAAGSADTRRDNSAHVAHVEYEGLSIPLIGPGSGISTREQVDEALNLILGRNGYAKH
jgi:hypothetical protein